MKYLLGLAVVVATVGVQAQELRVHCVDPFPFHYCHGVVSAAKRIIGPSEVVLSIVDPEYFGRQGATLGDRTRAITVSDGVRALVSTKAMFGNPSTKGMLFEVTISDAAFETVMLDKRGVATARRFDTDTMERVLWQIRGFLRGWDAAKELQN